MYQLAETHSFKTSKPLQSKGLKNGGPGGIRTLDTEYIVFKVLKRSLNVRVSPYSINEVLKNIRFWKLTENLIQCIGICIR